MLAHFLKTTFPDGRKVYLCHACHNAKCSNPKHLYWGTPRENQIDYINNGGLTLNQRLIAKHGKEKYMQLKTEQCRRIARSGGLARAKKIKSSDNAGA
jgi:hypothetical protein